MSLVYFLLLGATYTMVFWAPTLIKSWGVTDLFTIGIPSAIPSLVGVFAMVLFGRSSDRCKERRWHFMTTVAIAAIAVIGFASATPLFFTVTTEYLPKAAAAGGIALISSIGNLGAAVSPSITGAINASTGSPVYRCTW